MERQEFEPRDSEYLGSVGPGQPATSGGRRLVEVPAMARLQRWCEQLGGKRPGWKRQVRVVPTSRGGGEPGASPPGDALIESKGRLWPKLKSIDFGSGHVLRPVNPIRISTRGGMLDPGRMITSDQGRVIVETAGKSGSYDRNVLSDSTTSGVTAPNRTCAPLRSEAARARFPTARRVRTRARSRDWRGPAHAGYSVLPAAP